LTHSTLPPPNRSPSLPPPIAPHHYHPLNRSPFSSTPNRLRFGCKKKKQKNDFFDLSEVDLEEIINSFSRKQIKIFKNIELKTSMLKNNYEKTEKKFGLIKYYALSLHRF
jgi:hypothetical protein